MYILHIALKTEVQRSVGSKDRAETIETDRRTDRRTLIATISSRLARPIKSLVNHCVSGSVPVKTHLLFKGTRTNIIRTCRFLPTISVVRLEQSVHCEYFCLCVCVCVCVWCDSVTADLDIS